MRKGGQFDGVLLIMLAHPTSSEMVLDAQEFSLLVKNFFKADLFFLFFSVNVAWSHREESGGTST